MLVLSIPAWQYYPWGSVGLFIWLTRHTCTLQVRQFPPAGIIKDRTPQLSSDISGSSTALLIYADNNNHVGVSKAQVRRDQDAVMKALHARGLDMHDVTEAASLSESLGVRIDGLDGKVQPTPKRDWRLDRALSACCRGVRLSGQELQVIIGHIAVRSLLHGGFLGSPGMRKAGQSFGGVLCKSYTFSGILCPWGSAASNRGGPAHSIARMLIFLEDWDAMMSGGVSESVTRGP